MRKSLFSLMLVGVLTITTLYSPKSEALVGVIFKKKVVKVIGGIGAIGGTTIGVSGLAMATGSSATLGSAIVGAIFIAYGIAIGGVGLIILDDGTLADIEFTKIDVNNSEQYINLGLTKSQVEVYNSELEMLNSIRQTIISEVDESDNTDQAEKLWLQYADNISAETFEVAKAQAKLFVEAL